MATVFPYPGLGAFTLFAKQRFRQLIEPKVVLVRRKYEIQDWRSSLSTHSLIHEPFAKAADARACCARVGPGGSGRSGSGRADRCATGGRPRLSDPRTGRGLCRVSARQRGCRRRERSDGQDNQFTLLENCLNYFEDGQWKESEDLIEPVPDGAVARRGPHKASFSSDLNAAAAFDILTSDGKRLRGGVRAIQLTDLASGKSVTLAKVKASAPG